MKPTSFLFLLLLTGCTTSAQNNFDWRYDRTGVYSEEKGLLKSWQPEGPELLWYFDDLGRGYSSVSVANNKLFTTGEHDGKGMLYELSMTGKLQRKIEYGNEFVDSYPGSRSALIANEGKLYIVSGMAELFCFDILSFKLLWKKNYAKEYGTENTKHGWNGPPLIVDDKLIIAPGGKKHNVVALNKTTGEIIWSSEGAGVMAGYGVPILISDQEKPQVAIMMSDYIIGIDLFCGKLLWKYPHTNRFREHPNTPVYSNNMLFCMSSYGKGSIMLRLSNGGTNVEKVWEQPLLGHQSGHVVKFEDYIYGSGEKASWHCVDWETGKIMFSDQTLARGNIIAADGMLYCYSDKGELALVKPNPEKFEIVGKFSITFGTEQHFAHPIIHNGIMYVRHGDAVMAYSLKIY